MATLDSAQLRIIELLTRGVTATLGAGHAEVIADHAQNIAALAVGDTVRLTAVASDVCRRVGVTSSDAWRWASADSTIAAIDARQGMVTARAEGTTILRASRAI